MNRAEKANARKTIPPMIVTMEAKQEKQRQLNYGVDYKTSNHCICTLFYRLSVGGSSDTGPHSLFS